MRIRADIADLLERGLSNAAIARETGAAWRTVEKHRQALGVTPTSQGRRPTPPPPPAEAWRALTEPADGGHLLWTGPTLPDGTPRHIDGGRAYSVRVLAFQDRTGQVPQGPVLPECEQPDCVEPRHLENQLGRDRLAQLAAAIGI
ncbi:hypothetical protein ABZ312_23590 [Streptomyces sp. NPDC006207]